MPLGGMVPLVNMMMGEVIFGGVGSGMYGMLILVIVTVFIAGLMVGRTPEYLGKKVQAYEVQLSMLYVLIFPLIILGFAAVSVLAPSFGTSSLANHGPHGLSEILAVAGSLATKKITPPSLGTFPVNSTLFTVLLVGVILIVGALTFFPALSLGPILEHLLLRAGTSFS